MLPRGLPGLGVLPAGVGGVVEVQEEAFAAIEEAEAEEVVPDKRKGGDDEHVVVKDKPGFAGGSL